MEMYDTKDQRNEALRRQQERTVHAWMRAAAYASGTAADEKIFERREPGLVEVDLGQAVEPKQRNNRALGLYQRLGFELCEDKGVYLYLEWLPGSLPAPQPQTAGTDSADSRQ